MDKHKHDELIPQKRKRDDYFDEPPVEIGVVKSRSRRLFSCRGCLFILLALLLCGALVGGILYVVLRPAYEVSSNFMRALRDQNYAAAFDLTTRSLQDELGGLEGLQQLITEHKAVPQKWSFTSQIVRNGRGHFQGTVHFQDGSKRSLHIWLDWEDGGWKVSGFEI